MTKKAQRIAKRIHVKDRNRVSSSMESRQETAEIQAKAEQLAALEAKVTDLETQAAALSAQTQAVQAECDQLKAQAAENLDGWQRARAEFTNYKRRVEAERTELAASAGAEALKRVLPAVDDFERAMQTLPDDLKEHPWVNGVLMVQRKLNAALEQSGITPLATTPGDTFDPNIHEAVTHEDSEQFTSEQIIGEVQRGYKLGERVLRPAMVRVAR
ncbi:Protein GrpE [Thermoflexales bacterium]|nr:Protein GrpE [Thermoflexales bacterium]